MASYFETIARKPYASETERRAFNQRQRERSLPLLRLALLVSAVATFDFMTWEVYLGSTQETFPLRIFGSVFYLALLALGYTSVGARHIGFGFAIYALVFASTLAGVMALSPLAFEERLPGLLFYVVAILAISPHFSWTVAAYVVLLVAVNIGLVAVGTSPGTQLIANAFIASWIVTATAIAYYFDLRRRYDFRVEQERERERELLKRLATVDTLTGVANRRYFLSLMKREVERSRRHGHTLSVAMLDIDHFKKINDTYGHDAGDRCLKAFCKVIGKRLRISDHFGRLGGEEFALIFPETTLNEALQTVDHLRQRLETMNMTLNGLRIVMTMSGGVTQASDDDLSIDETLKRADRLLYRAKAKGRNRIESVEPPTEPR